MGEEEETPRGVERRHPTLDVTPSPCTSCELGANTALLVLLRPRTPPSRSPLRIPHYTMGCPDMLKTVY
jgi:hypothetical protein